MRKKNSRAWAALQYLVMKRFQILFAKIFPYCAVSALVIALMIYGSNGNRNGEEKTPIAKSYDSAGFVVTADQVSETYTVASIASAVNLPSTSTINENYFAVNNLYTNTGTVASDTGAAIEKPVTIDVSGLSRGIIVYEVKDGDSVESIANAYGLTKDQLRWSNGLKDESISTGDKLEIPPVAGIVYEVKEDDTIDSIAEKYESNKEEIIAYNDLENSDISKGNKIILPGGTLPEKERPEYVAPAPVVASTPSYNYTYSYVVDSGIRHNMVEIGSYAYWSQVYYDTLWQNNPGAFGNCTWFAWYWRRNNMPENYWLPTGAIGNASSWIYTLGGSYATGRVPAYGAVIQSTSGYYGHVGVVTGVNEGVSITMQEMNYSGPNGMFNHVYESTVDWNDALSYNYIYAHF